MAMAVSTVPMPMVQAAETVAYDETTTGGEETAEDTRKVLDAPLISVTAPEAGETPANAVSLDHTTSPQVFEDVAADPATLTTEGLTVTKETITDEDGEKEIQAFSGKITAANNGENNAKFNISGNNTQVVIKFKIKPNQITGKTWLIGKMDNQYGIQIDGDSKQINFYSENPLVSGEKYTQWPDIHYSFQDDFWGQWHEIVAVYTGSKMQLFVDGNAGELTSGRPENATWKTDSNSIFTLGYNVAKEESLTSPYSGQFADVEMYTYGGTDAIGADAAYADINTALAKMSKIFDLDVQAEDENAAPNYTIESTWTDSEDTELTDEDTFVEGESYNLKVVLKAEDGYKFIDDNVPDSFQIGEDDTIDVTKSEVSKDGTTMTLFCTFEVSETGDMPISAPFITVTAPEKGKKRADANVDVDIWDGSDVTTTVKWTDANGKDLTEEDIFEAGQEYTLTIKMETADDEEAIFDEDSIPEEISVGDKTVTVDPSENADISNGGRTMILTFVFSVSADEIQYEKLTGLTGSAESWEVNGEKNQDSGPAEKALDGNPETYWHSNYNDETDNNHKVTYADGVLTKYNNYYITLQKKATVKEVTYVPRTENGAVTGNGCITKCNIYTSSDSGANWVLAGTAEWDYTDKVEQTFELSTPVSGVDKIKVEVLNTKGADEASANKFINAAEFGVIGKEDTETPAESEERKALTEALEAAAKVEAEDNYTAESYAKYETALAAANELKDNPDATEEQLKAAADALKDAIEGLVRCTCTLSEITGVDDVISITLEATEESKEVTLNPQITVEGDCQANHDKENITYSYEIISGNDVIKVENGKITTLKEFGTATIKIKASLATINSKKITREKEITVKVTTKKATAQEKDELNTQVTKVEAQYPSEQYDEDDYQTMSDAIKNAKELLNKSTASKEDIENAKTAITNAARDLAQLKDTYEAEIRRLHTEIGGFNEKHYTTESWKKLTDADAAATNLLLAATTPTPKQLKEAVTKLSQAKAGLVVQHTYDVTWDWTWNEEEQTYTAAKATLKCKYCDEEQNLIGTVNINTTDATCTEDGKIIYTASVEFNGVTYTTTGNDIKEVPVQATGHTYGEPGWNWEKTEKGYKVTATFKCSKCEEGTEGHQVIVEAAKVEMTGEVAPGCETKGSKTYKATVTFNGKPYDNTETEEVAALGHKLTKTAAKAATCTAAGNSEYYTCSECGKYFSDAAGKNEIAKDSWLIKAKGHTITKKETPATADREGKIEYSCDVCKNYVEKTFILPKTEISVYMGKTANLISDASKCSITLANAKKYKKYFTLDTKTGKIKTSTKKLSKVKIKKTIPVKVTVDGKAYNVNVKLKIAAPKIKIKRKKIVIGGVSGYRYELQYNIKGATRVKIRVKKMSVLNKKFDANMSKPKSSKSRCYINASSSGLKKLGNKLTFEIVAYYGKNVSQKFIKRI